MLKSATLLACAIATLGVCAPANAGGILYVDDNAPPGGNGVAWSTAFRYLQDALAAASIPANGVTEVRVAQGVYRPDQNASSPAGTADREATFRLIENVTLAGGYLGLSAGRGQDPNARDVSAYETILNGDLAGDDLPPPAPGTIVALESFANSTENSYQVVTALNVDETAVIDGFTVTGGYADGASLGATPDSRDQGSGMNIYFSSPTLIRCTFLHNWNFNHGAVNDHGDFTSLAQCTFRANYANLFGSGLYSHHHSATTATDCVFQDNRTPGEGGGGYSRSMRFAAYINCEFHNNAATKGGGMYNAPQSTTTLTNCLIQNNGAFFGGGTYSDDSTALISQCTIQNNFAESQGGGMYNNVGGPSIVDCHFLANYAPGGGGGTWNDRSNASMTDCVYEGNIAEGAGGAGLYNLGGLPSVTDCLFTANVSGGGGGGLWNGENSPVVSNCVFIANVAVSGGGAYNTDNSSPTVIGCTFTSNYAEEGAGLYNVSSNSIVTQCTFTGNIAAGPNFAVGGGMSNYFCDPQIIECEFVDNQALFGGGGMYNEGNAPSIRNCTFIRNTAYGDEQGWGGGMFNAYFTSANIVNCLFAGNTANYGGAIHNLALSEPNIINCTIAGNAAESLGNGGAVFSFSNSAGSITNCILWQNSPDEIAGDPTAVRYSCVQGGYGEPSDNNINADPQFLTPPGFGADGIWGTDDDAYGDLRLSLNSPCIDAGDNSAMIAGINVDLGDEPRIVDDPHTPDTGWPDSSIAIIDMGAHEFQPLLCVADIAPAGPPAGDGVVNVNDLLLVINHWGACPPAPAACPADLAPAVHDGVVNVIDLLAVINAWGACR